MRRRNFFKVFAGGTVSLAGLQFVAGSAATNSKGMAASAASERTEDHYQAPEWLRYARAVYFNGYSPPVYPHIRDFDAKRLLDVVEELGADTLRSQPIGYWAYFPSKVFRVHPELGGRDLMDEVVRECRRRSVHHYCYTGYGHPHMEIGWVDEHPQYADWVLRGPDGKPYGPYWHSAGWAFRQRLCIMGDAYRQAIRQLVTELCEYDTEGVYFDSPSAYRGICFCESCRRNFKKYSGMDIDRLGGFVKYGGILPFDWEELPSDADMPALAAWVEWANQLVKEDLIDFRKIIHGKAKFMLCHNAATWTGTSLPLQYRIPDGFMVEDSAQTYQRVVAGLMGASMARPYKKLAQTYLGGHDMGVPQHAHPYTVQNTNLEDTDEIRMEGFTNLATGNAPLYATANRLYYRIGSGNFDAAREVFEVMQRAEVIHKDSLLLPYVTIVPTWESLQLWRLRRKSWNWRMMCEAFALVMLDERISFNVAPSTELSEEWLAGQRVIALCGASGISDEVAKRLAAWVERGGGLLATYDTGLFDEKGRMREGGGALREVLGVEMKGAPLDTQPECYYRMQEAHPALGEYGKGAIVQGDGRLVPVEVRKGATVLADCWNLGNDESRGPAIVAHAYGNGRTIYISGSLEALYLSSRVPSIRRLLGSVVTHLAGGEPRPFHLSAPRGVYGVLRQATSGDLIFWVLANVGSKDADVGRTRQDYVPVLDIEVSLRVPEGKQVKSMNLIRAGRSLPFRIADGYAVATVPSIHIAEVIQLKFA